MKKEKIEIVICDFDNTLFDWFEFWYKSYSILVNNLLKYTNIEEDKLLNGIRAVHKKHRTSEYNRLLDELLILKEGRTESELNKLYELVLPQYFETRKNELKLYPLVLETLLKIKEKGIKLVIYTESQPIYSYYRLSKLGLADIVDALYAPESHPTNYQSTLYSKYDFEIDIQQHRAKLVQLPKEDKKPNPKVLLDILKDNGSAPEEAIYIGDSMMKDICMANYANVTSVFADYGVKHHLAEYDLLRKVSHWTDEDVQKEKDFIKDDCIPNYSIKTFSELISLIESL